MNALHLMLGVLALFLPLVLILMAYDLRWIVMAVRAGQTPPWGAFLRIVAAICCHIGAVVIAFFAPVWPENLTKFWLHMTFDPGLTFYAIGLWELYHRLQKGKEGAGAQSH